MIYRKDIDLLRTVAVLLVVIFHADKTFLTGGFIGVDVFFVISGFLITSIIYPQIKVGKFSYKTFFIKRANRLLPASLIMTATTVLLFAFLYPSNLFENVVEAALSSIFFSSNIYFWQTAGYFNPSNELQPFLHTWSLSLEEQFYLVWPFTLILLSYFALKFQYIVITTAIVVSVILSIMFIPNEVSYIGYFVLPTRFFELGLGGLLAIYLFGNNKTYLFDSKFINKDLGLAIIIFSAIWLTPASPFPGYLALLPVIGALIYISAKRSSYLFKLLDTRPALFIGLISYSLYLWHWPIITVLKWSFNELSVIHYTFYVLSSFSLAYLSYRYIENPFREKRLNKNVKRVGVTFGTTTLLVCFLLMNKNYFISPVPEIYHTQYKNINDYSEAHRKCIDQARKRGPWEPCVIAKDIEHSPNIFVWGDSHAGAFMTVFEHLDAQYNITVSLHSGCPSLPTIERKGATDCQIVNHAVMEHLANENYDLILNVSAWNNYKLQDLIVYDEQQHKENVIQDAINNLVNFYEENNINYLFVEQPPIFTNNVSGDFFKTYLFDISMEKMTINDYQKQKVNFQDTIVNQDNVYNFSHYLCSPEYCKPTVEDKLMFKDKDHISNNMAQLLSSDFAELLTDKFRQNNHSRKSHENSAFNL